MSFPSHDPNVWLWELQDWFRDDPDYRPPPPTPVLSSMYHHATLSPITGAHDAYSYFMEWTPLQEEDDYQYQDARSPTALSHEDSDGSVDLMYPCSPRPGCAEPERSSTMRVYDGTEENFLGFLAETSESDADETAGGTLVSATRWDPLPRTTSAGGTNLKQESFDFAGTWPAENTSSHVRSAGLSATSSLAGALGPSVSSDARRSPDAMQEANLPPILWKSRQKTESSKTCRSSASKRVHFVAEVGSAMSQDQEHAGPPRGLPDGERSPASQLPVSIVYTRPRPSSPPTASTSSRVSARVPWYTRTETPQFSHQQLQHRILRGPFRWESLVDDWLACTHCIAFAGKKPRNIERHAFFCAQNPNRISFTEWGTAGIKDVRRAVAVGAAVVH